MNSTNFKFMSNLKEISINNFDFSRSSKFMLAMPFVFTRPGRQEC
jgi:hypothetical protein